MTQLQFGSLDSSRPIDSGRSVAGSILIHAVVVALLFGVAGQAPKLALAGAQPHVIYSILEPPPARLRPQPVRAPKAVHEPARIPAPRTAPAPRAAFTPPKVARVPRVASLEPPPSIPQPQPIPNTPATLPPLPLPAPPPKREVKTGMFDARTAALNPAPKLTVTPGVFAGASGSADRDVGGSGGPRAVAPSGFGDAAAGTARRGSGSGGGAAAGVVGGFGDAASASPKAESRPQIRSSEFQAPVAVERSKPAAEAALQPPTTAVTILDKPRPDYTEEARTLRIEGQVLLEVLFPASGRPRVIRVIKGLGHGLDQNAIRAAEAIRFRPALRSGSPVDVVANAYINFQLAY